MSIRITKIAKYWIKVFIITLILVFVVRNLLIQPYTVSSAQMETSLLQGDRVLVNKTAYGVRMPISLLTIPFTFDSIFGFKAYSRLVELPYYRLFASKINLNDVVLFNNPLEIDKPLDKRNLCLSRCVAVSGDTIQMNGFNFLINGKEYITSPDLVLEFRYKTAVLDSLKLLMQELNIPARDMKVDTDWSYVSFNRYEAFLLNQNLPSPLEVTEKQRSDYNIIIPAKGMVIELNEDNIPIYKPIILAEQQGRAHFEGNKLYIDDKPYYEYNFLYDYYWLLSDNVDESADSRYFGLISEQDIIGKAAFIWSSVGKEGVRWNRFFSSIL